MYFRVLIETEFKRGGSPFEILRYAEAENTLLLFDKLEGMPGLSNKDIGYAITSVKSISKREYEKGKESEKKDPRMLRVHVRYLIKEECRIEPAGEANSFDVPLVSHTVDISAGGLGISTGSVKLKGDEEVIVSIKNLDIRKKRAQVAWSKGEEGNYSAGLFWL